MHAALKKVTVGMHCCDLRNWYSDLKLFVLRTKKRRNLRKMVQAKKEHVEWRAALLWLPFFSHTFLAEICSEEAIRSKAT